MSLRGQGKNVNSQSPLPLVFQFGRSDDLPSAGAGETPIVGVAPAIGNAIFDATGKRLRAMPLRIV